MQAGGAVGAGQEADERLPHQLAGALHGRTGARLTLRDAAARVNLRVTDLPGLLYRVSTPAGSGLAPQVTGDHGTVRLGLRVTGDDGPDTVDVLLNRTVRWQIRLAAGAGEQHLDLSAASPGAVDLGAGVGLVRVRLPRPRGTVAIRLTGTVGRAELFRPAGVPVRVRLGGGATALSMPGTARADAVPGSVWASPGWTTAPGRVHVDAREPVGTLVIRS
jgi:hypothetical protein